MPDTTKVRYMGQEMELWERYLEMLLSDSRLSPMRQWINWIYFLKHGYLPSQIVDVSGATYNAVSVQGVQKSYEDFFYQDIVPILKDMKLMEWNNK